ncbi:MAG: hypothetical protein K2N71_12830 [Oscillospiraceae bacterium]|nr:hypothetical protein [Oscillospiraceae bacterium]
MKPKVKKVLFILTFLPYAFLLLIGLWGAIFGATFFSTSYGLDGFLLNAGLTLYIMVVVIPVIPVLVIFHLLCLLRKTVPFIKKISTKKFIVICSVLCFAVAAAILFRTFSSPNLFF